MPGSDLALDQDLRSAEKSWIHNKIIWTWRKEAQIVYNRVIGVNKITFLGIKMSHKENSEIRKSGNKRNKNHASIGFFL
jgi:hypothetical protein